MEQKYQSVERMFEKTHVFMTMNTLPKVLKQNPPKYETDDERCERIAFRNRCEFFHMTKTHYSTEKFPYKPPDLAAWLLDQII